MTFYWRSTLWKNPRTEKSKYSAEWRDEFGAIWTLQYTSRDSTTCSVKQPWTKFEKQTQNSSPNNACTNLLRWTVEMQVIKLIRASKNYATEIDEIIEQNPKQILWIKQDEFWSPTLDDDANFLSQTKAKSKTQTQKTVLFVYRKVE